MNGAPAKKRMLVVCPYPEGVAAGQRLKFEQYFDDWRADGWDVVSAPFMDLAMWRVLYEPGRLPSKAFGVFKGYLRRLGDLFRLPQYDLVYCHMNVTPVGTTLFERLFRLLARRLVFDVEDNVATAAQEMAQDHPNPLIRFVRSRDKARYLVRTADHVVTASPAVKDACLAINRKKACSCIAASVDTDRFVPTIRDKDARPLTIGWTGTFSSRHYLDLLRDVFAKLAAIRPFRLRVIGNFDYQLPGVDLDVVRWNAEREVEQLQAIDIGVYPLPIDDWVTGKAGLKAIQYMAFGIPCVATDVGATPGIIRDGENGLLVRAEDEWLRSLVRLIDDPALRQRLGERARRDAVASYSTRAMAGEYRRVLDCVMES